MPINESIIAELQQEANSTRKELERVPMDKADWKPHEKSTPLGRLAIHVAELPSFINAALDADEFDLAKMEYKPSTASSSDDLIRIFNERIDKAVESLKKADDETMMKPWTFRNGEKFSMTMPKVNVIRSFSLNHSIHHRAQLGVYLRLLGVPLPQIYGPTADEPM